jgi:hypothetical protein
MANVNRNEYSSTYTAKIRTYKANVMILESRMDKFESELRMLSNKVSKSELRDKQIINMFKMILDKYYIKHTDKEYKVEEIVAYIYKLVRDNKYLDDEKFDLIDSIVDKQNVSGDTIGLNPGEKNARV